MHVERDVLGRLLITRENQRELGLLLGYPECCVNEWIADANSGNWGQARRRGSVTTHTRSSEEIAALVAQGVPPEAFHGDPDARYVPCSACCSAPLTAAA